MKSNKGKMKTLIILTSALLIASVIYRLGFFNPDPQGNRIEKEMGNRRAVSIWMKKDYYSQNIKAAVDEYNKMSKDIYIDFRTYEKDYFNMLKLSMLTQNKPDIFSFGYYEYLRNGLLYSLDELNADYKKIPANNIYSYMGDPMGVKVSGYTAKIAWNKDIVKASGLNPDEAPDTWGDILVWAEKIKAAFPDVVPLEFPANTYGDLRVSIGENSVNEGSVYTTFWNFDKGRYDFDYARQIISIYNEMYSRDLIPKDFIDKDRERVKQDFIDKKAAIIISTYEDKVHFLTDKPLGFQLGVSDMPTFKEGQERKYYFVENTNILVATKNDDNYEDVKSVYNWIISRVLDRQTSGVLNFASDNQEFAEYDNDRYFNYEEKDPTGSFEYDFGKAAKLFQDGIEGKLSVNEVIDKLNEFSNKSVEVQEKDNPGYFENYMDRE